jgi:hypothetical protein
MLLMLDYCEEAGQALAGQALLKTRANLAVTEDSAFNNRISKKKTCQRCEPKNISIIGFIFRDGLTDPGTV